MEPVNSCTDCGLVFDSSKSLDVHLSYHKENLLSKWGSSATSGGGGTGSEANNNVNVKKEKVQPDSSDFLFGFQQQQDFRQQLQHQQQQQQQQQQMISRGYRFHPYGYERQVSSSQVNCEKCGLSMDASQLVEHNSQMHPWEEPQAEILDLDSHKVHVYQPPDETPPWRYFKEENGNTSPELGGVSTTTNSGGGNDLFNYEPSPQQKFLPKAAAWKSNEARRPKTYNCSACNKWFTSSGHLKRHYNTTLHKNAVKQSGGLDPAAMPVATHHHPPPQPPQQQQQQQQQQEETSSSTSSWHQPQSAGGGNSAGQQQPAPPALYAHPPPPPDVAPPPPPSAYFLSGYHHPNGEPPRRMLPSFSQLTGVSYDRDMAGGLDDHREAVLEMHHQVQSPHQPHQPAAQQDLHTSISKQLLSTQLMPVYLPPPPVVTCTDTLLVGNENDTTTPVYRNQNNTSSPPNYSPAYDPATAVVSSTQEEAAQVHKCIDCDKTFNKACYLTQHNKSFHAGDKPYKCNRCGKRFTQEYLHLEHISKHAGEKPHKCEICPKQFNHKTDLRRHMCLHSGDKPYACHFCGKGFIRKDHMLKHSETHRKKQNAGHNKKEDFLRSMVIQQVMQ